MPRFAILMYDDDRAWNALPETVQRQVAREHGAFARSLEARRKRVCAFRFRPSEEAETVRRSLYGSFSEDGGTAHRDSDALGGLYVIEAESRDEALDWARRCRFLVGANEVREVWE